MNDSIHPTQPTRSAELRALVEALYTAACDEGRTLAHPKSREHLRAAFDRTDAAKGALLRHVETAPEAVTQ